MTAAPVATPATWSPEATTRRLARWLLPYLGLCLLGAWRLAAVPESETPFGSTLRFYPHAWQIILALESLPLLVLLPRVWRWLPTHCAICLGIIMTLSTDLLLFSWCMIKVLSPLSILLMALFMLKAGFDGWVLCRAIERWDSFLENRARMPPA